MSNRKTSDQATIEAAIGDKLAVDASNVTPGMIDAAAELPLAAQPLTGEIIDNAIEAGMVALGGAFHEQEQRIVADNGKAYPVNAMLPDGVADTGELAIVNRFGFIQSRVLESVVDAIDYQLGGAKERLKKNVESLQASRRMVNEGRSVLTEADLERKLSFVETQQEQVFLLERAYKAAAHSYELATGHAYSTREERKTLAQARRLASNPVPTSNRFAS